MHPRPCAVVIDQSCQRVCHAIFDLLDITIAQGVVGLLDPQHANDFVTTSTE